MPEIFKIIKKVLNNFYFYFNCKALSQIFIHIKKERAISK